MICNRAERRGLLVNWYPRYHVICRNKRRLRAGRGLRKSLPPVPRLAVPRSTARTGQHAAAVARFLQRSEATLLVHISHCHGDMELAGADADVVRDIQVHHWSVPLLPIQYAALAELAATQSLLQRLLRESASESWPTWQRSVLDPTSASLWYVREWFAASPTKALYVT